MDLFDEEDSFGDGGDPYDQPSYRSIRLTATYDSGSDSDSGEEAERFLDDVCRDVEANHTGATLRLAGRVGDPGVSRLSFALMHNTTLTTLFIRDHEMGPSGAKQLAEALMRNSCLSTLDLLGNTIGDSGALHLGKLLGRNRALTALRLGTNEIGYEGAAHIADALRGNKTLRLLNLAWNCIADPGANHMARMLIENDTLKTLDIGGNAIGPAGAKQLSYALRSNQSLSKLYMGGNSLNAAVLNSLNLLLAEAFEQGSDGGSADAEEDSLPKLECKAWTFEENEEHWHERQLCDQLEEGVACLLFTASPAGIGSHVEGTFSVTVVYDWHGARELPRHSRLAVSASDPTVEGALGQALTKQETLRFPYEGAGSTFKVYVQAICESLVRQAPHIRLRVSFCKLGDSEETEHSLWETSVTVTPRKEPARDVNEESSEEELAAASAVAAEEVRRSKEELLAGFLTLPDVCDRATRTMCRRGHWFYVARLALDSAGQPTTTGMKLRPIWPSFDVEDQSIADFVQWLRLTSTEAGDERAILANEVLCQAQDRDDRPFLSINCAAFSWQSSAFADFVSFCRRQERILGRVLDDPREDREAARARRAEAKKALEEGTEKELLTLALLVGVQRANGAMEPLEGPYNDVDSLAQTLRETYGERCIVKVLTDRSPGYSSKVRGKGMKKALLTCLTILEEACKGDKRRGQLLLYCAGNCTVRPEGSYFLPSSCPPGEDSSRGLFISAIVATQLLMNRPMLAVWDCVRSGTGSRLVPSSSFGVASGGDQTLTVLVCSSDRRIAREGMNENGQVRGRFSVRFAEKISQWYTEGAWETGAKEVCSAPDFAEQMHAALRSDGHAKVLHASYPIVHSSEERTFRCFLF